MKKFKAEINVMLHPEILDPQGKAVGSSMKYLDLPEIGNVRVGKHITFDLTAGDRDEAAEKVETACKKLLANLVMERFSYTLAEVQL